MVKQEPYSPTIAIRLLNSGIKKELEAMARKSSAGRKYEAYRRRILHRKPLPRTSPPKTGLSAVVLELKRAGVTDRAVNRALAGWVPPPKKVKAPKKKKKSNRAATRYTPMYDVFNTMSKQPIAFKHVYIRPRSTLNSVVRSIPQSKTPIYRLF